MIPELILSISMVCDVYVPASCGQLVTDVRLAWFLIGGGAEVEA